MRSDYTKVRKGKYYAMEKRFEQMTISRKSDYGARGTTPNYYVPSELRDLERVRKNSTY